MRKIFYSVCLIPVMNVYVKHDLLGQTRIFPKITIVWSLRFS